MIKKLQKKYALSEQGAKDLIKGCLACVLQNLSFMFPVGLLYYLVSDLMNGGVPGGKIPFYVAGCVVCIGLILLTTFFQYNATYFATYKESGVRRITLAEHLRFGDLAALVDGDGGHAAAADDQNFAHDGFSFISNYFC